MFLTFLKKSQEINAPASGRKVHYNHRFSIILLKFSLTVFRSKTIPLTYSTLRLKTLNVMLQLYTFATQQQTEEIQETKRK